MNGNIFQNIEKKDSIYYYLTADSVKYWNAKNYSINYVFYKKKNCYLEFDENRSVIISSQQDAIFNKIFKIRGKTLMFLYEMPDKTTSPADINMEIIKITDDTLILRNKIRDIIFIKSSDQTTPLSKSFDISKISLPRINLSQNRILSIIRLQFDIYKHNCPTIIKAEYRIHINKLGGIDRISYFKKPFDYEQYKSFYLALLFCIKNMPFLPAENIETKEKCDMEIIFLFFIHK